MPVVGRDDHVAGSSGGLSGELAAWPCSRLRRSRSSPFEMNSATFAGVAHPTMEPIATSATITFAARSMKGVTALVYQALTIS